MNDSQQLKRGQVAPFNPNPRWPENGGMGVKSAVDCFALKRHMSRLLKL